MDLLVAEEALPGTPKEQPPTLISMDVLGTLALREETAENPLQFGGGGGGIKLSPGNKDEGGNADGEEQT